MTPMQAIVASTRMGAELLQLADKVGTLEPGKLADLVVVLLPDTKRIVCVMKDGVAHRNELPAGRGAPAGRT
jgi:imidazolonepropionase-like amidohydrolase